MPKRNYTKSDSRMLSNSAPRSVAAHFVILVLCLVFVTFGVLSEHVFAQAPDANALLSAWIKAQTNMQTSWADLPQPRTFKPMSQRLTAAGHVGLAAPGRFRWELGKPPRTIAVGEPDQLVVLYPRLKRAERYPLNTPQA